MAEKKITLFGGTFDPIHLGHATVATKAAKQIGAEKTIFVPAKHSVLKDLYPEASDEDRLKMVALAIAENKDFQLSDYELNKPEPGYTIETIRHFQADHGSDTLIHWLVGADSVDELSRWHKIVELIDECNLCVMFRAGYDPPNFAKFTDIWGPQRVEKLQQNIIPTPLIDISSTEIRNRLAAGLDVTNMLHPSVAGYISKHSLYQ